MVFDKAAYMREYKRAAREQARKDGLCANCLTRPVRDGSVARCEYCHAQRKRHAARRLNEFELNGGSVMECSLGHRQRCSVCSKDPGDEA